MRGFGIFRWACYSFGLLVVAVSAQTTSKVAQSTSNPSPTLETTSASKSSQGTPTHTIDVGKGNFQYSPDSVNANVGDIVEFNFFPPNHSVARAAYEQPCIPYELTGTGRVGFFSGFHALSTIVENPPTFRLLINDTDPIFFYCSAPGSCIKSQMVGVINPNSTTSLATQKADAKAASYMIVPGQGFPSEDGTNPESTNPESPNAPTSSNTSKSSGIPTHHLSPGAIAGISIGCVAVAMLVGAFLFLLGRHTTLLQHLKRLHRPTPSPPAELDPNVHYSSAVQPPYSPGSFGSPRSDMTEFKPYHDNTVGSHPAFPPAELSTSGSIKKNTFSAYSDMTAYDDVRRQTLSPTPKMMETHSELEGEAPRRSPQVFKSRMVEEEE